MSPYTLTHSSLWIRQIRQRASPFGIGAYLQSYGATLITPSRLTFLLNRLGTASSYIIESLLHKTYLLAAYATPNKQLV